MIPANAIQTVLDVLLIRDFLLTPDRLATACRLVRTAAVMQAVVGQGSAPRRLSTSGRQPRNRPNYLLARFLREGVFGGGGTFRK